MLPCHPFYGFKVKILQRGKTDTQEWCLIRHPEQLGFHYRIPTRWLDNHPPQERLSFSYQKNIIAFPFTQLQKLALFVNYKLKNISFGSVNTDIMNSGEQQIITEAKLHETGNEEESGNLEQYSQEAENKTFCEASMDIDINKQKE